MISLEKGWSTSLRFGSAGSRQPIPWDPRDEKERCPPSSVTGWWFFALPRPEKWAMASMAMLNNQMYKYIYICTWLVVDLPWKIWKSVGIRWHSQYDGKVIIHSSSSHHQPDENFWPRFFWATEPPCSPEQNQNYPNFWKVKTSQPPNILMISVEKWQTLVIFWVSTLHQACSLATKIRTRGSGHSNRPMGGNGWDTYLHDHILGE